MGDLSWNPCTWTPSNIAESAVEGLSGSEFLGDLAGAGLSFLTGDVLGGLDQVADGLDNVASFLGDSRVIDAAGDAFLGSTSAPAESSPCSCGWGGETEQTGSGKPTSETSQSGGASGDMGPIDLSSAGSLEEKIQMLLEALMEKKEKSIEGDADKIAGMAEGADKEKALRKLQKDMNSLQQMNQLLTNMTSSFHQMNQAVIQNIR